MLCILLAARESDKTFRREFSRLVARYFSTICIFEKEMQATGASADLLITDVQSCKQVETDPVIAIFRDALHIPSALLAGKRAAAVVDSCNREIFSAAGASELDAITCGLSTRDTLTLSSTGVDSTVLNLQRSVACFDGTIAEPQEIPLHVREVPDNFTLMAAAAVFVLTGNTQQLLETRF